ncbi:hypothetical protein JCM8097_004359 [Rhodosporidiobolus ruineniae]
MSTVARSGPSYATARAGTAPYPPPTTSKPGQPRPAAQQQQQLRGGLSERQIARGKWTRIFGAAPYLDPGSSNRLVLSLRSGIPTEVDFALDRLVQVSSLDPDLLRLNELPGLLDGLLAQLRDYLDRRRADRAQGLPSFTPALGGEPREALRRRAAEAALVLRNIAPLKGSADIVVRSKRLRKLICDLLDEGNVAGAGAVDAEETTEVRLYLLEVLEGFADKVPLALPGHAITPDAVEGDEDDSRPPPKPEPASSPAVRLFPLLVALTRSEDRALVIAAFRCLTVLSTNNKSDSVFALLTYEAVEPLPKPFPHPIQTAVELLPLADAEITTAALDFIYQHTTLPSNSVLFSSRPDLLAVLRLLGTKLHLKGKAETVEIDLRVATSEGRNHGEQVQKRHAPARTLAQQVDVNPESPIAPEELAAMLYLPEPERCIAWMRTVYELDPSSDITQVAFWKSYEQLFQRNVHAGLPGVPPLLTASDVIKHASDGHPSAQPIVLEVPERKFVIRGIRLRNRPELQSRNRCKWTGCTSPSLLDSPSSCYAHLLDAHLSPSLPASSIPPACAWNGCVYTPSAAHASDPALRRADLALHVRSHLDFLPASHASSSSSSTSASTGSGLPDLPAILTHERHHAERDVPSSSSSAPTNPGLHSAAGASLLSVLILRNLARTAKSAVDAKLASSGAGSSSSAGAGGGAQQGPGGVSVASGNAAIGRLAGDEQSIFEAFALAAEGSASLGAVGGGGAGGKKDSVLARLEKVDFSAAFPAVVEALLGVEDGLVKMVMSDVALGKVLAEVVQLVEYCRGKMGVLLKPAAM